MTETENTYPEFPMGQTGQDLITPTSGHGLCVTTGIAMGHVNLAIEVLDHPPEAIDETREWEAISELNFLAETTAARKNLREYHLLQLWPVDATEAPIDYRIDDRWEHQHFGQSRGDPRCRRACAEPSGQRATERARRRSGGVKAAPVTTVVAAEGWPVRLLISRVADPEAVRSTPTRSPSRR